MEENVQIIEQIMQLLEEDKKEAEVTTFCVNYIFITFQLKIASAVRLYVYVT